MDNNIVKSKTAYVIVITVITMIIEIIFGIYTESVALTSDGFHMGTHAVAITITYIICILINKNKYSEKRLNAIGGYTSAILLGYTAFGILYAGIKRILIPEIIRFDEAIIVATIGFIINALCILIMKEKHHHNDHESENINYKAAYIHIVADAFTSVLAIFALFTGKYLNLIILDPIVGIIGAFIILKWAISLIKKGFSDLINN